VDWAQVGKRLEQKINASTQPIVILCSENPSVRLSSSRMRLLHQLFPSTRIIAPETALKEHVSAFINVSVTSNPKLINSVTGGLGISQTIMWLDPTMSIRELQQVKTELAEPEEVSSDQVNQMRLRREDFLPTWNLDPRGTFFSDLMDLTS
jgi:hypothetical protein